MLRAIGTWRSGAAVVALLAGLGVARAEDAGLFAVAEAGAVLDIRGSSMAIDDSPTGATAPAPTPIVEPPLPAETQTSAPEVSPSSEFPAIPAAVAAPTTADKLPAVLDALVARPGALPSLGAGDWRAAREAVRNFYSDRQFIPAWTNAAGFSDAGRAALARLAKADEDGLNLKVFALPKADLAESDPDKLAVIEATLASAIAVYALEASGARIAPATISPEVTAKAEIVDPAKALAAIAAALDADAAMQAFNPPQEGYVRLRDKLSQLSKPVVAPANMQIPPVGRKLVAPGALSDAHAIVFRPALAPSKADPEGPRRQAILANMEMWRWEPREMGRDRIEVNVPDYSLRLIKDGAEADSTRVIVGKPDTPTPIFSNSVKYLLVNPIWRVPQSIMKKEMMPHLADDPDYFEHIGYNVRKIGGQTFVEQPPGERNALGRILFMFPNEHDVYLHDTPARGLFSAGRRAFSHGCIRVEQPLRLAMEVMGGPAAGWSQQKVQGLLGPNERWVYMPTPLPIHIEYFTEFVSDNGVLHEKEDIYGLTSKVAASLSRLSQD